MSLALKIAGRYLFSRKSHSAINLISLVSVLGVAVTTMAIICTLSVYNGFQDVVFSLCSRLDPPVKVEPVKGKTLDTRAPEMVALEGWRDEVAAVVPVVEENALAVFGNHQMPVFLKGMGENYAQVHTHLDETLLDGEFMLNDTAGCYIALGAGVASRLETGPFFSRPIRIYSPRRNVRVNMANPSSSFRERESFASAVFAVNQQEYDESWVLAPLALVRELYDYTTEASALELRLHDGVDEAAFAARLQEYLGDGYRVSDRLQQQASAYNMMQIEKWITFLILLFILLIATFNVIGSLSMLIIDKQADIHTLHSLGADDALISRIFWIEGWLISAIGAGGGLLLGIGLCWVQQTFGLLRMGGVPGTFVVDAYPVHFLWSDAGVVLLAVVALGFVASWIPVRYLRRRWLSRADEVVSAD